MATSPTPAMFSWQQPLAALFGGISAAGQPGGWSNFGAGVNQTMQQQQSNAQNQQMMQLRQMQMQQAEEEMRRANKEAADREAAGQQIASMFGTGAQGGRPAMFGSWSPEQRMLVQQLAQQDPQRALGFVTEQAFAQPDKPKASSEIGQIMADVESGFITPQQAQERIAKMNYIAPQQGPGPGVFQGTGLDAQSYNIVLEGTKSGQIDTPEYRAAYAQLAMPKVTFDPVTQKLVSVAPDMSWAQAPGGTAAPSAPADQAAAGGAETMQLPGATVTSTQGAPIYNETQGKAAGFADRMQASASIFDEASVSSAGQNLAQSGLSAIPVIGNFLTSKDRQKFEQAERDFINAQLRRESGAVIAESEFKDARKQYIPQPGDSKEVLEQKRVARQRAVESMAREGGPFYKPKAQTDPNNPYSGMSDEEFEKAIRKGQGG